MYCFSHFLKTQRCLKGMNIPVWHILRVLHIYRGNKVAFG